MKSGLLPSLRSLAITIAFVLNLSIDGIAQSMLDSCFTSANPSTSFTSSATLIDSYDADLLEWTGAAWNGSWPNANINIAPPCNTPPVRALWVGDDVIWTTGGESFGFRFSPPLVAGASYQFFFTYVSVGLGSNGAFSPNVYTNNTGATGGNYVGDLIPAGYNWETHPFTFVATPAQAGDEFLIIHSNTGSGMVLNFCAETFTDLGNDSLTICFGDTAVLFAGNGFQSYSWNTGETTSQITVTTSGTYIATTQGFCTTTSDTIVVTVDPCGMFPIAIFTTPDNHICPGTCTDFNNLSQNASAYFWTFTGASPSTSTDVNPAGICYNTPGTYAVQLIAENSLTSDTLLLNNFITVYPYPPAQGIVQNGDTLFANAGAATYQWYHDGLLIPGATEAFYVAPEGGDYNVVATDANGCEVEAAIFDVIASIAHADAGSRLRLYPNPVMEKLTVESIDSPLQEVTIRSILGQAVFLIREMNTMTLDVELNHLPPGLYLIELTLKDNVVRKNFLKE